jgi:hypothetical protein
MIQRCILGGVLHESEPGTINICELSLPEYHVFARAQEVLVLNCEGSNEGEGQGKVILFTGVEAYKYRLVCFSWYCHLITCISVF